MIAWWWECTPVVPSLRSLPLHQLGDVPGIVGLLLRQYDDFRF